MHWAKFIANCPNRELLQEMVIRTAKWVIRIAYKGARSLNLKQAHLGIYIEFIIFIIKIIITRSSKMNVAPWLR